ncbi:septum formation initiator family protein [Anaerocolumna sp. AGMB13025]|uniref:FtsB family cell division protein n=1 Tax=Anaerocolumna sp. AGMB13025 TaxID=3039116 RepID=UPI00241F0749|nr:septum formation initiator family protein [Anaerocolumna sp. AGMB13025]WFR57186.1 septum formation initiator family protein [Anaerocolumna sp. AGMB13025]
MRRKRKARRRTGLGLIAVMVLLVCGIVTYNRQELDKTNAKAAARIAELKDDIDQAKDEAKEIKEQKAYVQTKKYVEEMAREKLGLVYKDEIIFKAEDKN